MKDDDWLDTSGRFLHCKNDPELNCVTGKATEPEDERCPDCDGPMYLETGHDAALRPNGIAQIPGAQYRCDHCGRLIRGEAH